MPHRPEFFPKVHRIIVEIILVIGALKLAYDVLRAMWKS